MPPWANNPALWIVAGLAVVGAIFAVGKWAGAVNSDRDSFKEFMAEVRDDIKEILGRLPPRTVAGASPLTLTDLGRRVSQRLGASAIARDLAPLLHGAAAGQSEYDIQAMCFSYIEDKYEPPPEVEALIRACAYENGIDRKQVMDVLVVELRDSLLEMLGMRG